MKIALAIIAASLSLSACGENIQSSEAPSRIKGSDDAMQKIINQAPRSRFIKETPESRARLEAEVKRSTPEENLKRVLEQAPPSRFVKGSPEHAAAQARLSEGQSISSSQGDRLDRTGATAHAASTSRP